MKKIIIPLRTKKLIDDAIWLEKQEKYQPAILSYVNYLEQVLLVSSIQYLRKNPEKALKFIKKIEKTKSEEKLTLGKIILMSPQEIFIKDTKEKCHKIRKIRNHVGAHQFFSIELGYTFLQKEDVENHKNMIKSLYSLINDEIKIKKVEVFLKEMKSSLLHKQISEITMDLEKEIMKEICIKTAKLVECSSKLILKHSIQT